jgi:sugar phosphate isomerase/epimerase
MTSSRLATADFTFPLLPHDHALDLISKLGFDGVDIGLFEGRSHLQPSTQFRSLRKNARALRRKLADRGLKPADIFLQTAPDFVSLAPNHPERRRRAKARQLFLQTLEYTNECGAKHVSALPGVLFPQEPRAASFDRCCEEHAWRRDQARSAGIIFSVEAHIGSIAPVPEAALRLLEATPGLTLTLDYTHFVRRGISEAEVEPLIAHASHFHARGARKGRLQCSLKQNTIDYARIIRVMKRTGYRGFIGIEYVWIDWEHCNDVDNLSEVILLRDFIRKTWNA